MANYVLGIGIIMLVLMGWVFVQHLYRVFAARHPELGPFRDETGSCGSCGCGGGGGNCASDDGKG